MNKGIIHYSNRPKNTNQCVGEKFNILFVRLNHFLGINNIPNGCVIAPWLTPVLTRGPILVSFPLSPVIVNSETTYPVFSLLPCLFVNPVFRFWKPFFLILKITQSLIVLQYLVLH